MDALVTLANGCFITGYFFRSIIWLRAFALTGSGCLVVYFYTMPQPLLNMVYWNLVYVGINLVWLARILLVRFAHPPAAGDNQPRVDTE